MRRAESWESLQFVSIRGMHMKMATILVLRFHILLLDCLWSELRFLLYYSFEWYRRYQYEDDDIAVIPNDNRVYPWIIVQKARKGPCYTEPPHAIWCISKSPIGGSGSQVMMLPSGWETCLPAKFCQERSAEFLKGRKKEGQTIEINNRKWQMPCFWKSSFQTCLQTNRLPRLNTMTGPLDRLEGTNPMPFLPLVWLCWNIWVSASGEVSCLAGIFFNDMTLFDIFVD